MVTEVSSVARLTDRNEGANEDVGTRVPTCDDTLPAQGVTDQNSTRFNDKPSLEQNKIHIHTPTVPARYGSGS